MKERHMTQPALTVLIPNTELFPQSATEQQASHFVKHLSIKLVRHSAHRKAMCSLIKIQVVIKYPYYSPQLTSPYCNPICNLCHIVTGCIRYIVCTYIHTYMYMCIYTHTQYQVQMAINSPCKNSFSVEAMVPMPSDGFRLQN